MKKATGPVAISSDATVTISQEFGVRGTDPVNEMAHVCQCAHVHRRVRAFIRGSRRSCAVGGTVYTAATSVASIAGVPTPTGDAAMLFTVANTGSALTLTVKSGIIDVVRDWNLQTNDVNAAANNTAAVAAHVAEVVDGTILYFPSGDYWFTDTLDLSSVTATNVRLWNPAGTAKLRGGVRAGAASNVTVDELVFSGCGAGDRGDEHGGTYRHGLHLRQGGRLV